MNLFCSFGVGENDVVVYIIFNMNEMFYMFFGGMIVGIVNLINLFLDLE